MDIKQLATFLEISKSRSFTLASQSLNYAQSTLTAQIQSLEKELGVRLFERLGHRISLTSEGKRLLPYAERIVKLTYEAKKSMEYSDGLNGALYIGAVESLCVIRLPKLLKEYRLRYPKIEIALKFGSCGDFLHQLKENTLDIAFFLESKINEEEFKTEIEFPEPMALLAAPESPLARKENVYPEDLNGQSFILTEPGCAYRALFEKMLAQFNIRPNSIIETGNVQAIKQLTISGLGITLLPLVAVEEECSRERLVPLSWRGPEFKILTQVLYHKDKWMSKPLKAFIDLMHEIKL